MKLTNKDIVQRSLEKISYLQEATEAHYAALRVAQRLRQGIADPVNPGNIGTVLIQAELDEWRGLFMWGLTLTDAEREPIKAMAHARFMDDRASVSEWLTGNLGRVDSWLESDEAAFRDLARRHFEPRKEEEDGRS